MDSPLRSSFKPIGQHHADRAGQAFMVLGLVQGNGDFGPVYEIRFMDGFEAMALPEELFYGCDTCIKRPTCLNTQKRWCPECAES